MQNQENAIEKRDLEVTELTLKCLTLPEDALQRRSLVAPLGDPVNSIDFAQ